MQHALALLKAAVAWGYPVSPETAAGIIAPLAQECIPSALRMSSALLYLAILGSLPKLLWQQHCRSLETELSFMSGHARGACGCFLVMVMLQCIGSHCAGSKASNSLKKTSRAWLLLQLRSDAGDFSLPDTLKLAARRVCG